MVFQSRGGIIHVPVHIQRPARVLRSNGMVGVTKRASLLRLALCFAVSLEVEPQCELSNAMTAGVAGGRN